MLYNVVLKTKSGEILDTLKGYDNRPLRFNNYNYAYEAAQEINKVEGKLEYTVIEEGKISCNCKDKKCLNYC